MGEASRRHAFLSLEPGRVPPIPRLASCAHASRSSARVYTSSNLDDVSISSTACLLCFSSSSLRKSGKSQPRLAGRRRRRHAQRVQRPGRQVGCFTLFQVTTLTAHRHRCTQMQCTVASRSAVLDRTALLPPRWSGPAPPGSAGGDGAERAGCPLHNNSSIHRSSSSSKATESCTSMRWTRSGWDGHAAVLVAAAAVLLGRTRRICWSWRPPGRPACMTQRQQAALALTMG